MSAYLPDPVQKVIDEFQKLPGVGPKSAARMAYHYLRGGNDDAIALSEALSEMAENVMRCEKCYNVADSEVCKICDSPLREATQLCVVEEPLDVGAFEQSGIYKGFYFVLGGVISPADGIGAQDLRFEQLEKRVRELLNQSDSIELIVGTNPSLEGEATSSYINDMFRSMVGEGRLKITRLAMGLPTGADLEYADRLTLKRALEGRQIV